jgi:3-oxoacyl-(acyl-carrier-protein) synthase/3-hydroxymyristoyl/3-hydroxydecanoyl-(acyl carrier protein) dehydratase
MSFSPIAIVGQGCVLPGALSPEELWSLVSDGRVLVGPAPAGRWGLDPRLVLASDAKDTHDKTLHDRGGYVQGFERVFDPRGFALSPDQIVGLDPLFQWLLHAGREALRDVRFRGDKTRAGVIVGNLSYPSSSLAQFAERFWLEQSAPDLLAKLNLPAIDPRNRFMSGLPAHLCAKALGLGGLAFALDAACASSLYAIKLACDQLQDGDADLILAGAVNRADDLFIHQGFTALGALSPSGKSRPFHAEADGLMPAEGAAMVALRRLEDARRDGDRILGVIRGIGLSNDGRSRGLLVPSQDGQMRALRAAYAAAELSPNDVSMIECHATGTSVGDAVEIRALAEVFAGREQPLPIGSLKANLGHLITAAGAAGLLKVLASLRAGMRPPTPSLDKITPTLTGTPLRLLSKPEPWNEPGLRRAAVSAFGFGGNNAHLIVEETTGKPPAPRKPAHARVPVGIVAIGARVGDGRCTADFARALFAGQGDGTPASETALSLKGLKFPPKDLEEALPQQWQILAAAREAVDQLKTPLPAERTSVYVGMQCDAEIARHGARWRVAGWAEALEAPKDWIPQARDGFVPLLGAAGVIGAMPNVVSNRLNSQFDFGGPSHSVSAEELSGIRALEIARRALEQGEVDAALVGAVDMCAEPVHTAAARACLPESRHQGGDAAVVLVLKRLEDIRRDGDEVLAVLGEERGRVPDLQLGDGENLLSLHTRFGHAHAASGLLHVAAAALCCAHRLLPGSDGTVTPWKGRAPRGALVVTKALGEQTACTFIEEPLLRRPQADVSSETFLQTLAAGARLPEAPLLVQPAHRTQPVLPEFAAEPEVQIMEPAPVLPSALAEALAFAPAFGAAGVGVIVGVSGSVSGSGSGVAAGVGGSGERERTAGRESAARVPPTNSLTLPLSPTQTASRVPPTNTLTHTLSPTQTASREPLPSDVVTRALAFREQLARVHREHIEQQAAAHQAFLVSRQRALAILLGQPLAAPAPMAAPAPVAMPKASAAEPAIEAPRGRTFSREELQVHAEGRISDLFGPQFAEQDQHALQVRMPQPPLLLADRVVGLKGEPASMGLGTVWTETDVREDSWFLNRGFMPAGILIESGQADLFLISYLGIDLINQGKRSYRLLGCELTYHGSLPRPGETLRYDIHVDSHARQGDVRLFFFHYDCLCNGRPMLTVRKGQAGFFSRQELDDSAGVLWIPEGQEILPNPRLDAPAVACTRNHFTAEQVRAFSEGDLFACFGPGFEAGQSHVRTPAIQFGKMLLVEWVDEFDPKGGPWQRGYLKATTPISPEDWFFAGHFKNDPCMPGTLMFEGCLQMMAIYLAGMGYTLNRDGWRFEAVPEETYKLQCRGQVIPTSKNLVCEMFVEEVHDGPFPTVYADLLGTVDGLKAFHARRVGLRLVPDWPLSDRPDELAACPDRPDVAQVNGFRFDQRSLLACAWGKPSEAFGPMYASFDGPRRVARLPGPPYHFMSRVMRVDGAMGEPKAGAAIDAEYDVPASAWYFDENGAPVMPFCVLLEAALQPCGWLASYVGSALGTDQDLAFRNLDGTSQVLGELRPGSGPLRTTTTLKSISRSGGMILETFQVRCMQGDRPILQMDTGFGFFPAATFANQAGLPTAPEQAAELTTPSDFLVDLRSRPARYCEGSLRLPGPMLLMLDRVTACDPRGGRAGLGTLRAEKDVDPSEWFFKAHFFQDPVQPGSLGIEAMLQLLQFHMLHAGLGEGIANPRFEPIATGRALTWKYRGQVVPQNRVISATLEITEQGRDADGAYAVAESSLWVDGKRIYHATGVGMRIVGERSAPRLPQPCTGATLVPLVRDAWRGLLGGSVGPVEDVCRALVGRFLRQMHVSDWDALQAATANGAILLGNHQVTMESTVFALVASALFGKPLLTLARIENQISWLDPFMRHAFAYPGLHRLQMSQYFERSNGASLPAIIDEMSAEVRATGRSVMVHVEGAMALSCRTPVTKMSGAFIDMALALGRPIVPVRFVGGLPVDPVADEIDFPVGLGQQDIHLGAPIPAEEWQSLNLRDRRERLLDAINQLGPSNDIEEPFAPDPALASAANRWAEQTGVHFGLAVVFTLLQQLPEPSPEVVTLIEGAKAGSLRVPATPEGQWLAEMARRLYGPHGPKILG